MIELALRKSYGQTASTSDERGGRRASNRQVTRRPYWLITTHKTSRLEVLTLGSEGDEALPVFSFEEEAELYIRFWAGGASEDWSVRETSVGELTSVLYGQCASVGQVALDPLPKVCGGALDGLCGVRREEFVRRLMGEVTSTSPRMAAPASGLASRVLI